MIRVFVIAGMLAAGTLQAQQRTCRPELVRSGGTGRSIEVAGGFHQFLGGGVVARCIGQSTTMRSDSVAWYSERNRMDFERAVRFADSTVVLNADRATYYTTDERLEAFGNVRLMNLTTGSILTGTRLTYFRDAPGLRDTVEIYAINRPTVEYRSSAEPTAPPYVIVADRVRMRGSSVAWAGGAVTIDREDFAALGDSARLDTEGGEGFLLGRAKASGSDSAGYTLEGRRIAFRLTGNRLSWIQAQDSGTARSAEWTLMGDTIELVLERDLLQGGAAWGDANRPRAISSDQTITADSLVIRSPDQVLETVLGIGRGLAESVNPDSGEVPTDWLAGDTVVASFATIESGARALISLNASGSARSYYHIYQDTTRVGRPAINYARGRLITVHFSNSELQRVDVVDGADGIYLEPPRIRRP